MNTRLILEKRPQSSFSTFLSHDFLASIVTFLVALPLCMGIAIASGMPPASGLMCGIIGGILVGIISGSPLQVSGPAAGLSVVVYDLVTKYGAEGMALIVIGGGAVQLLAGCFRLGRWFRAVPPSVIHGMLAGIGLMILLSQFHVMVDDVPRSSALQNLITLHLAIGEMMFPDGDNRHVAGYIGLLTIAIIVGWQVLAPKRIRLIPGALVAIVAATVVTEAAGLTIKRVEIPAQIMDAIRLPQWDNLSLFLQPAVLGAVFAMAAIASAETLLCASAVDSMQSHTRTRYDRELCAQGVGNMLCGAVGALPMTGVIVRSSANVQAGARTRLSTILHGVWLLAAVLFLTSILSRIPTASLAALLVYTGYRLCAPKHAKELLRYGKSELAIFLITMIAIVITDLLTGVIIGVVLAALKLLYRFSHLEVRQEAGTLGVTTLRLCGSCTFLGLPRLAAALETIPGNTALHVHLEDLEYIDHACLDLLMNWEKQHAANGGSLSLDWGQLHARFWGNAREEKKAPA